MYFFKGITQAKADNTSNYYHVMQVGAVEYVIYEWMVKKDDKVIKKVTKEDMMVKNFIFVFSCQILKF